MTIQQTENYSLFNKITGNRNINNKKIDKIIEDVNSGLNLLPYCPIIVYKAILDDSFYIMDGQHRFEVSKKLGQPVYYVIAEDFTLQQIALLNSRQDKWTVNDFLRAYIKIGMQDYITLSEIVSQFKVGLICSAQYLMYGKIGQSKDITHVFREGKFVINFKNETIELFELTLSLFEMYRFSTDRNLITAVKDIKEKGLCDFEILKEKINAAPMMMNQNATVKDYIYNIERVYNYKNKDRRPIF